MTCCTQVLIAPATVSDSAPIETAHDARIHDAQLDYCGKRLATCSSDCTVKVFDIVDGDTQRSAGHTLKGGRAHPKHGHILASSSYDGKVLIWKEQQGQRASANGWTKIKEHTLHSASVNSVSWAPHELDVILACASSDDKLSILTLKSIPFLQRYGAQITVNGACHRLQRPSPAPAQSIKRFTSAGYDNLVKIWVFREDSQGWVEEETLEGHTDWVRDVAWAPNIGLPRSYYISTASQDKTVLIWTKDTVSSPWVKTVWDPLSASTTPAAASSSKFLPYWYAVG
ncbi:WD40 repeat-like protein [Athelia psychrophila]|uniref:WD40 repeat-like protein n=1 Tax=Athelia psychrophila TaxID=1759441 RepID=A0A166M6R0_9AGAM|nr:WD40 repeat-like protein [Fibularhizoctonia sp. CBS 109695]